MDEVTNSEEQSNNWIDTTKINAADIPSEVVFGNKDGATIGKLIWGGGKMRFEGDVEESAKIFFNYLCDMFNIKDKQ